MFVMCLHEVFRRLARIDFKSIQESHVRNYAIMGQKRALGEAFFTSDLQGTKQVLRDIAESPWTEAEKAFIFSSTHVPSDTVKYLDPLSALVDFYAAQHYWQGHQANIIFNEMLESGMDPFHYGVTRGRGVETGMHHMARSYPLSKMTERFCEAMDKEACHWESPIRDPQQKDYENYNRMLGEPLEIAVKFLIKKYGFEHIFDRIHGCKNSQGKNMLEVMDEKGQKAFSLFLEQCRIIYSSEAVALMSRPPT